MKNHLGERVLTTYKAWRQAIKRECPSATFDGDADICQAFGMWCGVRKPVGQWDGAEGTISYPKGEA